LLEPLSGDSFLAWGFLNTIFEREEYFETYSMEPVAEKMASENLKLKEEFLQAVNSDEKLRNNPYARLQFFYERSKYYNNHQNIDPIMRLTNKNTN